MSSSLGILYIWILINCKAAPFPCKLCGLQDNHLNCSKGEKQSFEGCRVNSVCTYSTPTVSWNAKWMNLFSMYTIGWFCALSGSVGSVERVVGKAEKLLLVPTSHSNLKTLDCCVNNYWYFSINKGVRALSVMNLKVKWNQIVWCMYTYFITAVFWCEESCGQFELQLHQWSVLLPVQKHHCSEPALWN